MIKQAEVKKERNKFNSISRAAVILDCMSNGINSITDIAEKCGINKTTVHRLLKSLEAANMAINDAVHHRYYLGPLLNKLVSNPRITHEYLINCAMPEMERLSKASKETVTLSTLIGYQHVSLYEIPSEQMLRVIEGSPGTRSLLSVGAPAKVLLSQLSDEELQTEVQGIKSKSLIDISETDQELLMSEVKRIKQEGHAVSYGERVAGVIGISAPVKNYIFPVALGILGPDSRIVMNVPNLISEVKASASQISDILKGTIKE